MLKLTLTCTHGTRTVEIPNEEPPRTGTYAIEWLFALQPRCPYCDPLDAHNTFPGPTVESRVRGLGSAN